MSDHMDIAGNEKVDEEAKKKAAREQLTEESSLQYKLKSVLATKIKDNINSVARKIWNNGTMNAKQHRKMTRPQRFKTGAQLYDDLSRNKQQI